MIDSTFTKAKNTYFKNSLETSTRISEEHIISAIQVLKEYIGGKERPGIYVSADGRSEKMLKKAISTHYKPYNGDLESSDIAILCSSSAKTKKVVEDLDNIIAYNNNENNKNKIHAIFFTGNIEEEASQKALQHKDYIKVIHDPSKSKLTEIKDNDKHDTINVQGTFFEQDVYRNVVSMLYTARKGTTSREEAYSVYKNTIGIFSYNILELPKNIDPESIKIIIDSLYDAYNDGKTIGLHGGEIPSALGIRLSQHKKEYIENQEKKAKTFNILPESDGDLNIHYDDSGINMNMYGNPYARIIMPAKAYEHLLEKTSLKSERDSLKKAIQLHNMVIMNDAVTAALLKKADSDQKTLQNHHIDDVNGNKKSMI